MTINHVATVAENFILYLKGKTNSRQILIKEIESELKKVVTGEAAVPSIELINAMIEAKIKPEALSKMLAAKIVAAFPGVDSSVYLAEAKRFEELFEKCKTMRIGATKHADKKKVHTSKMQVVNEK